MSALPARWSKSDALLLAIALAGAAIASNIAGQDANWDLRNYHLYNPWALLNGRYGFDLAPAQLQTFHNPLLDIPFYAVVAVDWHPRIIAAVMAVWTGLGAFFLFKLAHALFADVDRRLQTLGAVAAVTIGVTGANAWALIGSTMNEWPGAALGVASLWLLVRDLAADRLRLRTLLLAGFFMGCASGLKLTAATFALGIALALLLRRDHVAALRDTLVYSVGVLVGIALTLGFWMAFLNEHFGSPLFPYFNQLFHSPLLPPEPVLAAQFGPRTPLQWLMLPFDLLHPPRGYVAEVRHQDARFPVLATLALLSIATTVVVRFRKRESASAAPSTECLAAARRFVAVFFVVSFAIWASLHGIYRYLLTLEVLTGVAIVGLLLALVPARFAAASIVVLSVLLVATTRHPNWGRVEFGPHFLEVAMPPVNPGALVVLTADAPLSHVLLRFPTDARHVGIESNVIRARNATGLRERAAAIVMHHSGPIYQLTAPEFPAEWVLDAYGLARIPGGCAEVRSNLSSDPLVLCQVNRAAR